MINYYIFYVDINISYKCHKKEYPSDEITRKSIIHRYIIVRENRNVYHQELFLVHFIMYSISNTVFHWYPYLKCLTWASIEFNSTHHLEFFIISFRPFMSCGF